MREAFPHEHDKFVGQWVSEKGDSNMAQPHRVVILCITLSLASALGAGRVAGQALGFPPVNCYYVPEAGSVASPLQGTAAIPYFRMCPNNDGGSSLPNNARIRIVIRDVNNNNVAGFPASDISILFNGGTLAQGFSGSGADSIIANSTWNGFPLCPDVREIHPDAATDSLGITYITFTGANPSNPGIGVRDASRKWGHYDSGIPVFVAGFQINGRMAPGDNTPYVLRIKNFDWTGGLTAVANQGETVTSADINGVANNIGVNDALSYWRDFDSSGSVTTTDFNMISAHSTHNCGSPNSP
jgi:hypothetical protein